MEFNFDVALDQGQTQPPASPEVAPEDPGTIITVQKHDPFDLIPVKARLAVFDASIQDMVDAAVALQVDGPKALEQATEMGVQVKRLEKELTTAAGGITRPYFEFKKNVDAMVKGFTSRLGQVMAALNPKIIACRNRMEAERQEKERIAREEAARVQAQAEAEAKSLGVEPAKAVAPVVPKSDTVTRAATGTAHTRKVWEFKITDPAMVPAQYLVVDEKLIRADVAAGVREIPGVEIYQTEKMTYRT